MSRRNTPLALGAAVVIGLGSLFAAAPALAEDAGAAEQNAAAGSGVAPAEALSPEALSAEARQAIDSAESFEAMTGGEAVATGYSPEGELILLASEESANEKVEAFAEATAEGDTAFHKMLLTAPAIAYADTDVTGGAGYVTDGSTVCSIGFTAWNADGDPALLTAGHCTDDGATQLTGLTLPSQEPAVTGDVPGSGGIPNGTGILGDFGAWRFGGLPAGSSGAENDPESTDIAVIENIDAQFALLPEVTDWSAGGADDLAQSTIPVKSVADPVEGQVTASGRTSGLRQGDTTVTIDGDDITLLDGWLQVDDRWVHGFLNDAASSPGDSGGAVLQGNTAVGLVSGGPDDNSWTWATRLQDALELDEFSGYEIRLDIDAPVVESPADGALVDPGSDIVVSVPGNADELVASSDADPAEDVLDATSGEVTIQAPLTPGTYTYTFIARNGRSQSEPVTVTFEVDFMAPTIENVDVTASDGTGAAVTLNGTGVPGATVEVTIDGQVIGAVTVGSDGSWTLPLADPLAIGEHAVSATQSWEDEVSPVGTARATVRPGPPVITSFANGDGFALTDAPSTISGTGIDGATVTVTVAGRAYTATVTDGAWTIALDSPLIAGQYTVSATQTVNGLASDAVVVGFTVAAPVTDPGNPAATAPPSTAEGPTTVTTPGTGLVTTGAPSLLPYGVAAVVMLLLGATAIFLTRRQLRTDER
ncbi:Ig-like domain-containing protein [Leucobacter massiliensis]|uniref:Bacterial Ig domain-containing protein n=1 Tax=Leucobacter massiliensis TaxID=1686285 RepID=A0A2S9QN15_9MICO|nr:Ig-like domain-containing protein [Leucobacter massiliensis]PRI10984.1 hypothetical protein B4915_08875 [Leucobacter massiliensis]